MRSDLTSSGLLLLLRAEDCGRRACGRLQREQEGHAVRDQPDWGSAHGGGQDRQGSPRQRQEHTCMNPRHICHCSMFIELKFRHAHFSLISET